MKRIARKSGSLASRSPTGGWVDRRSRGGRFSGIFWLLLFCGWITLLLVVVGVLLSDLSWTAARALVAVSGGFLTVAAVLYLTMTMRRLKSGQGQIQQFHSFCYAIKQAADSLELQEIVDAAAKVIVEVTSVRGCSIKLMDYRTKRMTARSVVGLEKERVDRALDEVERMSQEGVMTRQSVIVQDVVIRDFPAVNEQFESLVCVPLRIEERLLGAICVFGEQGQRLSSEMISLLTSFGDIVSLAIAHALLYEDLEKVVETKTRFIFQTSHELRSPLNAIQSLAHTLLEGYVGGMNVEQRETVERIDRRAGVLSQIVGDLLMLAAGRAKTSALDMKPLNLDKLAEECVGLFEARAREKGIVVGFERRGGEPIVLGDEQGLRSVVTNLLSNAIKYTQEKGKVTVALSESGATVELDIADTGIGIPEAEQGRLFTEFFRASNAKSITEVGTGLGLAIVKATVEQHGGTIDVESIEGKGTRFRILLKKAPV